MSAVIVQVSRVDLERYLSMPIAAGVERLDKALRWDRTMDVLADGSLTITWRAMPVTHDPVPLADSDRDMARRRADG